jgi:hypothetical protein
MRHLILPFVTGLLLASCGGTTVKTVEKPVLPEPCRVGKPADLPEIDFVVGTDGTRELLATTPEELALLAAWVVNVAEWRDRVAACPFVQFVSGDLREAMSADPHLDATGK